MEVEEGGGEFVEDEGWAVEVDEGSLFQHCQHLHVFAIVSLPPEIVHTRFGKEGGRTYKPEAEHHQRSHRMRQQPPPKHTHIHDTDPQVPQKVSRGETLNHAPSPRIAPHPFLPAHARPLLVHSHDPERHGVDEHALEEGDDVDIPVEFRAGGEGRVDGGEEAGGEEGGEVGVDEAVGYRGEEELVDVVREGDEAEGVC